MVDFGRRENAELVLNPMYVRMYVCVCVYVYMYVRTYAPAIRQFTTTCSSPVHYHLLVAHEKLGDLPLLTVYVVKYISC